jgi:hypothetical protein
VKGKRLTVGRRTARRIRRRLGEGQRAKEADRRVKKRKDVGPSDVGSRVRGGIGGKENSFTEFDVTGGSSSEAMPEKPPTARGIRERSIVRMAAEEVTVVTTIRGASRGSSEGLR